MCGFNYIKFNDYCGQNNDSQSQNNERVNFYSEFTILLFFHKFLKIFDSDVTYQGFLSHYFIWQMREPSI